jgi:outer membrane protein assembly factor BamB
MSMHRLRLTTGILALALSAASTFAVKPASWTHEQPKDFTTGELKNVIVNSRGEVLLSREAKVVLDADKQADAVNALAQSEDGTIYAATGPNGHIYKVRGEEATKLATLPDGNIFSLLFAKDGRLLAGTGGGDQAKIYVIDDKGEPSVFYQPAGAKYVWAMARGPQGQIYAATGIEGKLFVIDADGKAGKVLADLKPKNLLCIAFGTDAMIYLGTDEDGLIYRVSPSTGKPYVMYDAAEAEVSALAIDGEGNIFAATAAADQARPGRAVADKPGGKPDAEERSSGVGKSPESQPADETPKSDGAKAQPSAPTTAPKMLAMSALATRQAGTRPTAQGAAVSAAGAAGSGNAIYRIDTFGFVTEVFREPVIILDLAEADGTLYAATGNEGRIYAVTPREDNKSMIAKLEPAQVTALLRTDDGSMVAGTANAPRIFRVSQGYAAKGTLVSKPIDAGQIVKWGRIKWDAIVPTGTKLTVATRSGNVGDEESEAWDEWSPEVDATTAQQIASPGARFLQYRLTLEATQPDLTARLARLNIARIEENRPPLISGVEVLSVVEEAKKPTSNPKVKQLAGAANYGDESAPVPQFHYVVKWTSEDPNQDALIYEVFYRQVGQARWVRLAKELKEALHIWDSRTVPDGKYELRVVADDRLANALGSELKDARLSDPVVVDNTAPTVQINRVERLGKGGARLQVTATDELSAIAEAGYRVDSQEECRVLTADDEVFDSLEEPFTITLQDLEPGDHWVSIRVSDEHGNARYVTQMITVED